MGQSLTELIAAVRAAVDAVVAVDLVEVPVEQVEALVALGRRAGDQLAAKRLEALRVVRVHGAWREDGSRSFAHHLVRREGGRLGHLRAELWLADTAGGHLPETVAAVRAGELFLDHLRVLARVADPPRRRETLADPQRGERLLLAQAGRLSDEEFARVAAAWAARADPDAEDEKYRAKRAEEHVSLARTLDGYHLQGWLAPDSGELLRTALDAIIGVPPVGDPRGPGERDAAALIAMARDLLDSGQFGKHKVVRPHLSVHVGFETLQRLSVGAGIDGLDPAWLSGGQPIPRWLLEKIACDCEITRIVFGPAGQVLDVGRTKRTFTRAQRRAIEARDGHCVWDNCPAPPSRCEAHHLWEWNDGGPTDLRNGALLCWYHHVYLHQKRLLLHREDDQWVIRHPNGVRYATWLAHPYAA